MSSFTYFAYGSNMLTARLRERCPSAVPLGLARAPGYSICFHKEGLDGSGKATLAPDEAGAAPGVLFRISLDERADLDRAEGRYDRHDAFAVHHAATGEPLTASTYLAQVDACRDGLVPYEWYVAIIVAGAREHGLDAAYLARLSALPVGIDADAQRAERMAALIIQKAAASLLP